MRALAAAGLVALFAAGGLAVPFPARTGLDLGMVTSPLICTSALKVDCADLERK